MQRFILGCSIFPLILACGGLERTSSDPKEQNDPKTEEGPRFAVSAQALRACATCPDWRPDPALSYQTPTGMRTGLLSVELMQSPTDPVPHVLWQAQAPQDIDLIAGATLVDLASGSIPPATYTHLRVTLAYVVWTVAATGHANGMSAPGDLDVDYAISSYLDGSQGQRTQGDYLATFTAFGSAISQAGNKSVVYPPAYPGAQANTSNSMYRVTFPTPMQPITITHGGAPQEIDVMLTFYVQDAFGWQDTGAPGHATDIFDLSYDPMTTEQPASLGIRGFELAFR